MKEVIEEALSFRNRCALKAFKKSATNNHKEMPLYKPYSSLALLVHSNVVRQMIILLGLLISSLEGVLDSDGPPSNLALSVSCVAYPSLILEAELEVSILKFENSCLFARLQSDCVAFLRARISKKLDRIEQPAFV